VFINGIITKIKKINALNQKIGIKTRSAGSTAYNNSSISVISWACAFCGFRLEETNNPDKKPAHSGYKLGCTRVFSISPRPVLML
jgi:hypothetical protein